MGQAQSVLIFGGAGFVGSNIAREFAAQGARVTVVDGLMKRTGGRELNVLSIRPPVKYVSTPIEGTAGLQRLVEEHDCIVDAMAWTSHLASLDDPLYDLHLNAESHLHLLSVLRKRQGARVIFLGSRGQFGNPGVEEIHDDLPMVPEDVQGIHKVASESYYRIYSKLHNLDVVSLRFPNCFGRNQLTDGNDIGLVGSFIREALAGGTIDVYGLGRQRSIVYVDDVAGVVASLASAPFTGFNRFNMSGKQITIENLARKIVSHVGRGAVSGSELPADIQAIEVGNAVMSEKRLLEFLGNIPSTDLDISLRTTIDYFEERAA